MIRIPSKTEILTWIAENPTKAAKRDIAKAFGIKGAARIDLKRVLRELEDEGQLQKRKSSYRDANKLPPVSVLEIAGADSDGDLFARPLEWAGEGDAPQVLMVMKPDEPALGAGDRVLGRLTEVRGEDYSYSARLIRRIGTNPLRILGVFRVGAEGGRIVPVDKGSQKEWVVAAGATGDAKDGELVEAEQA
ncbi:MAG: ribonuclease R, partial [Octadecabacter sp.]